MRTFTYFSMIEDSLYKETVVPAPCDCMVSKFDAKYNTGRSSMKHVLQIIGTSWDTLQRYYFRDYSRAYSADLSKSYYLSEMRRVMPKDMLDHVLLMGRPMKCYPFLCPAHHRVEDAVPKGTWVKEGERLFRHGFPWLYIKIPPALISFLTPGYPAALTPTQWPGSIHGPSRKISGEVIQSFKHTGYLYPDGSVDEEYYKISIISQGFQQFPAGTPMSVRLDFPMLPSNYKYPGEP